MAHTIKWTSGIQVLGGGPQKAVARSVEVDSYGVIAVDVNPNDVDVEVDVKVGSTGEVKLLAIASDRYTDLTYKVNSDSADPVTLDHPQVLFGNGAVRILDAAPDLLLFSNASTTDKASVQILVGRDATP